MNVMEIPVEVDAPGTFPKSLEKSIKELEIKGKIKTIRTAALLRSTRLLRRVLGIRGDLCYSVKEHQLICINNSDINIFAIIIPCENLARNNDSKSIDDNNNSRNNSIKKKRQISL